MDSSTDGGDVLTAASFLSLDTEPVVRVLSEPQAAQVLAAIVQKAAEFESLRNQQLYAQLNHEQQAHNAEIRAQNLQGQLDAATAELERLRQRVEASDEATRAEDARLRSQLEGLQKQNKALSRRVEELTSSSNESLALISRKNEALEEAEQEISRMRASMSESKKQVWHLEQELQAARDKEMAQSFKTSSMEKEVELLQKNNDWLNSELERVATAASTYRREKSMQINDLERSIDTLKSDAMAAGASASEAKSQYAEAAQTITELLEKVKSIQDNATAQEEYYESELSSQKRLSSLLEITADEAKKRVSVLESDLDDLQSRMNRQLEEAQAAFEAERRRVEELEQNYSDLEERLAAVDQKAGSATPNKAISSDGLGVLSPSAQYISKVQRSGLSVTQLSAEYLRVQRELSHEKNKTAKLQESLDQLISELEERAPRIQEQRDEFVRQQQELVEMSRLLDESGERRDAALSESKALSIRVRDLEQERAIHLQQHKDLSRQVRALLYEIELMGLPNQILSQEELAVFQRMLSDDEAASSESDAYAVVSEKLTVFKNITELQQQNQNLLRVTRELAKRMEDQEHTIRQSSTEASEVMMKEARDVIDQLNDQLESYKVKADAYARERDMFRRMLGDKANGSATEESGNAAAGRQSSDAVSADYQALLREMQLQFDSYRSETATDNKNLSSQVTDLNSKRMELQLQVSRLTSSLEMANERYSLLERSLEMSRSENSEQRKRTTQLQDALGKQDSRTQHIAEELVTTRSLLDSLRSENATVKAERDLAKTISERLSKDNDNLSNERLRLNKLVIDVQTMQNEQQREISEARLKLEAKLEQLEGDLRSTRSRHQEAMDRSRETEALHDAVVAGLNNTIEELRGNLSSAREEAAGLRSTESFYKAKVEDLEATLKGTNERLEILQNNFSQEPETTEHKLKLELSETRNKLDLAQSDLRNAREVADQMQSISSAAEEALQSLTATYDEYRKSTDEQLAAKESEIADLKTRLNDVIEELNGSRNELNEKVREMELIKNNEDSDYKKLEVEATRLRELEQEFIASKTVYQNDLRRQAEIASEAQSNYERELVKHADAARNIIALKDRLNEIQTDLQQARAAAESANVQLANASASWDIQKAALEKEIQDIKTRHEETVRQNGLLHDQLEQITVQVSKVHSSEEPEVENDGVAPGSDQGGQLQEVIRYLRREREIAVVQQEMSVQEAKRLKRQLDHTSRMLDEARGHLDQEREQSKIRALEDLKQQELLAKINELNILRESNTALRAENDANLQKIASLENDLDLARQEISPLEEAKRQLDAELGTLKNEIMLLTQDNERWRNRNQQILQKYERIDPQELKDLKDKCDSLESQIKELVSERDALKEETNSLQAKNQDVANAWKQQLDKTITSSKTRMASLRQQLTEKNKEFEEKANEARELQKKLEESATGASAAVSAEAETQKAELQSALEQAQAQTSKLEERISSLEQELEAAKTSTPAPPAPSSEQASELQTKVSELESKLAELEKSSTDQAANEKKIRSKALSLYREKEALKKQVEGLTTGQELPDALVERVVALLDAPDDSPLGKALAQKKEELGSHTAAGEDGTVSNAETKLTHRITELETELQQTREQLASAQDASTGASAATDEASNIEQRVAKEMENFEQRLQQAVHAAKEESEAAAAEKLQKQLKNVREENEMRNKLKFQKAEREINALKSKLAAIENGSSEQSDAQSTAATQDNKNDSTQSRGPGEAPARGGGSAARGRGSGRGRGGGRGGVDVSPANKMLQANNDPAPPNSKRPQVAKTTGQSTADSPTGPAKGRPQAVQQVGSKAALNAGAAQFTPTKRVRDDNAAADGNAKRSKET